MPIQRLASNPTTPRQLDPRDFPSFHAYRAAQARENNRARVRNLRVNHPHLSIDQIAGHASVPPHQVREFLHPDLTIGPLNPY